MGKVPTTSSTKASLSGEGERVKTGKQHRAVELNHCVFLEGFHSGFEEIFNISLLKQKEVVDHCHRSYYGVKIQLEFCIICVKKICLTFWNVTFLYRIIGKISPIKHKPVIKL